MSTVDYDGSRLATPHRDDVLTLAPSFEPGRFDSLAVDSPFVFSLDGRQGMTYLGWDGLGYQTALTWRDESGWLPGTVVLPRIAGSGLREFNAAMTGMVRDNDLWSRGELVAVEGWYYGTFHAYPGAGYEEGSARIGFVRSQDLLTWEETGSLIHPGDGGDWSCGGLYKSWLLQHEGLFHLFYNAKDVATGSWLEQTGHATSPDLIVWDHGDDAPVVAVGGAGAPDERFASDPCVLRDGDVWVMFYFGLAADGHARECYATSTDLLSWTKGGVLLDVGLGGHIDEVHAHKPAVIAWDGRLEHYYCAVSRRSPITVGGHTQRELRGIARATGDRRSPAGASRLSSAVG